MSAIEDQYREAFQAVSKTREPPEIDVKFYPYIGINHTIRVRDGKVFVRLAEVCREMPAVGHKALAYILVSKLFRKRVPKNARDVYSSFIKTAEMREQVTENKTFPRA